MKAIIKIKMYEHGADVKWRKKYFNHISDVLEKLKRYFNEVTMDDVD